MLGADQISREAAMTEGLILLAFLAVLVAFFTVRMRRRLGLTSTGRTWIIAITVFVVLGLLLWASAHQ
jgi:NhaP-type Na+/H+ and K+/H+ antiporter